MTPKIRARLDQARDMLARPWAITEEAAPTVVARVMESIEHPRAANDDDRLPPLRAKAVQGTAVIPVMGILTYYPEWMGYSVKEIRHMMASALEGSVDTMVFWVDSPGGEARGIEELADSIRSLSGKVRTIAMVDAMAASAAYWIASACDRVIATPSAMTGSIGVVSMHADWSAFLENMGVKVTLVTAGVGKADTSPYGPLSEEARARMQGMVDDTYAKFVGAVSKGRDLKASDIRGMGAHVYLNGDAKKLGLIDRVQTIEGLMDSLAQARDKKNQQMRSAREARRLRSV